MTKPLWDAVVDTTASALSSGALQPIETRTDIVKDGGVSFLTRVVSNLERKRLDGVRRGSNFNPFLHPEEALFVADLSETHYALLNKFNVVEHHVLIVTRAFEEQESLLTERDFEAAWIALGEIDGLAFYNAGSEAGASQRHKHLQIVPLPLGDGPELTPIDPILERLPFENAFRRIDDPARTRERYLEMLSAIGRADDPRAYNLLMTREWMLAVPRVREAWESISVNALGFAGALLVRSDDELERLRRVGPMTLLRQVSDSM